MTPKLKAENLVHQNRMLLMDYGDDYGEEIIVSVLAIKFALIAVNTFIPLLRPIHNHPHYPEDITEYTKEYWYKVKQEIENL